MRLRDHQAKAAGVHAVPRIELWRAPGPADCAVRPAAGAPPFVGGAVRGTEVPPGGWGGGGFYECTAVATSGPFCT